MRALVIGATGFIGRRLIDRLDRPMVLSRDAERARRALDRSDATVLACSGADEPVPADALDGVDTVFHLAGEPIASGRWTRRKRRALRDSRVHGTRRLVEAIQAGSQRPRTLVCASAVGYYGDCGDRELIESAPPGDDFLARICVDWEAEAQRAASLGVRVVCPRIGIVLGPAGGALAKMLPTFRLGLGSPLGTGRQWMPWIHRDDLVELLLFCAAHDAVAGPVNAVAPAPATNREFTVALGRVLRRPTILPAVPGLVLRTVLGEFGSVLLYSQRAAAARAIEAGFAFRHPNLEDALRQILPAC